MKKKIMQLMGELKPKINYRKVLSEARLSGVDPKTDEAKPLVGENITQEDFLSRYKVARLYTLVNLVFLVVSGYILISYARDFFSISISVLSTGIFLINYFKMSFKLWISRSLAENWSGRREPKFIFINDYIESITVNPLNILPLSIKFRDK